MSQPFNNNSSQAERKQVLKDTMFNRASSEAGEISGRWAKPTQVTGKDQAMHYPRLPTSSPWSNPIEAAEPPLGVDVNETPIVGESFEVEQSLNQDFGWRKTIRDGVPQAAGGLIPASPEPAPDGEVVRGGQAEEPALREPLPPSGRHSITQRRVSPNNIRRRLV